MNPFDSLFGEILKVAALAASEREKEAALNESQLKSLIDLTLVLGDKEWFMELSEQLIEMKGKKVIY